MTKSFSHKKFFTVSFCLLTLGAGLFSAYPSDAQTRERSTINRIERLENEIDTLSRAIYKGQTPEAPAGSPRVGEAARLQAATQVRIQELENELRTLTGRLEEQNYLISQLQSRIALLETQLGTGAQAQQANPPIRQGNARFSNPVQNAGPNSAETYLQNKGVYTPPQGPSGIQVSTLLEKQPSKQQGTANTQYTNQLPPNVKTLGTLRVSPDGEPLDPETGVPSEATGQDAQNVSSPIEAAVLEPTEKDPDDLYQEAFVSLRDKNYEAAEKQFRSFLDRFPNHKLVQNAIYWLGETYYVRNDFERAARLFAQGYQQFPEGSKAPDNLLKLGLSLASLGNKEDACLTLSQLERRFSTGAGPVIDRATREMKELECK